MARKRFYATAAAALLVIAATLTPWHLLAGQRLIALLEAQGASHVSLKVMGIGLHTLALQDISIGETSPLTLENLTIDYSPADLWNQRLKGLTLANLLLTISKSKTGWGVTGLEHIGGGAGGGNLIPVTADAVPLEAASIVNSQLHIASDFVSGDIPLHLNWQKYPQSSVDYTGTALSVKAGSIAATTGDATAHVTLDEKAKAWKGNWSIKAIALKGAPLDFPVTESSGNVTAEANRISLQGKWGNDKAGIKAVFRFDYSFAEPDRAKFTITSFTMPWNGGNITLKDAVIPLSGKQAYTVIIYINSVSVDALLQPLTGKRATATGSVSGSLPLTINPNGTFAFQKGALTAEQPGIIAMAPDAIPGDNAQITLLRDVMKDFHYKLLSLALDNDKNHKLSVTLNLQGNNPAVYNGRPVKLNVHLGGDVLDFITQSMAVNDPQKLIRQGTNAQ